MRQEHNSTHAARLRLAASVEGGSATPKATARWLAMAAGFVVLALVVGRRALPEPDRPMPYDTGVPATASDEFVESVAVNTHLRYEDTSYADFPKVRQRLLDLGVRHIRDGYTVGTPRVYERFRSLARAGIRTTFVMGAPLYGGEGSPYGDLDQLYRILVDELLGAAEAVEGPNEMDLSQVEDWASQTREYQEALHRMVTDAEATRHLPVIAPSIGRSEVVSHYAELGNVVPNADIGNLHVYPGGKMMSDAILGDAVAAVGMVTGDLPVYMTETGYHQSEQATDQPEGHPAVDDDVAGVLVPRILMESFRAGIGRTYLYELLDEHPDPLVAESNFGLLTARFEPKPAFTAVKNILEVLEDPGPAFDPGSLDFRLVGGGTSLRSILLQERDGTFYVALWLQEEVDTGADCSRPPGDAERVVIRSEQAVSGAAMYRPSCSASSVEVPVVEGALEVGVSGEVLLVELRPDV